MKRVLLTGVSAVGKSTVVGRLAQLGYRAIDTDEGGLAVDVHWAAGRERLWARGQDPRSLECCSSKPMMEQFVWRPVREYSVQGDQDPRVSDVP